MIRNHYCERESSFAMLLLCFPLVLVGMVLAFGIDAITAMRVKKYDPRT